MMTLELVFEARGLTKKFGSFAALDEFDIAVKAGEVHGFLGPNGAGKSTTIRVLLGMLKKTAGEVTLFGEDPWRQAVALHKRLVYVPGEVQFWDNLTGGEIIDVLGDLRGGIDETRLADLLAKFDLDPSKKFGTYSKGNRQKVALIAALACDVDLYVFDEPTSGLDPLMEEIFQHEVLTLKEQGKTILLSSHILAEVEALCDRITIIRAGKTVASSTLAELQHNHRAVWTVTTTSQLDGLASIEGVHSVTTDGDKTTFELEHGKAGAVVAYLGKHDVTDITSHPPDLESLFLAEYEKAA